MTVTMITGTQLIKRYRWLAILVVIVFLTIKGCELFPEASFELASESRLPKWLTLPPGITRADVSLTMNYYAVPWNYAIYVLRDKNGHVLKKYDGKMGCRVPYEPENPPEGFPSGYPIYQAISVNGITEIIEHKKMEPIFYVPDDPALGKRYESIGC
jgi:hypothetical protein